VLVFNDADSPVVKLTDLGYSAISVDDTFLPKTWPWVAPEWNKRRFDVPRAKKTDIYSFGMLCLWIMFSSGQVIHNPSVDGKSSTLCTPPDECSDPEGIQAMRDKDKLPALAESLINNSEGLDKEQRERLIQFFEKTVRTDPEHRELDIIKLLKLLDSQL
jgi:serine/threonine protein kinase